MLTRIRRHTVSFKHAWDGIWYTLKSQPNFRFHLIATVIVFLLGIYFSIDKNEWLVLLFTINMVLVAEMLNTSVESIVDLITQERREDAKIAKDVSAGMVLVSSSLAVIIGLVIFIPKIIANIS